MFKGLKRLNQFIFFESIFVLMLMFVLISCDKGKEPYRKAEAAEISKQYEESLSLYKKVLEYHNSDFFDQAKNKVIDLEKRLNEVDESLFQAENEIKKEEFDEAIQWIVKADSILPGYRKTATVFQFFKNSIMEYYISQGNNYVQKRDFDSAEKWYKRIAEIDEQDSRLEERLQFLEIEKSKIPYSVKVSDSEGFGGKFAKISNTSFTKNRISFDLFNSYTGGIIHGIYFQIKIVWKRRNGKTGTLIGNDQYVSNGETERVILDFPYGHSLPDDVVKIDINVDQFLNRFY